MSQAAKNDRDQELVDLLVDDARVQLDVWDKATKELIATNNLASIDELLRVTHTLKGCAFSVGFQDFGNYLHHLEDILGLVKSNEMRITALGQKFLVKVHRSLASWMESIETGRPEELELTLENLQHIIHLKDFDLNIKSSLGAILVESGVVTDAQIKAAIRVQNSRIGELLVSQNVITQRQLDDALEKQAAIIAAQPKRQEIEFEEKVFIPSGELDRLYELCKDALTVASGKSRRLVVEIQDIVEQYTSTPISRLESECKNVAGYLKNKLQKPLELDFDYSDEKIPKRTYHLLQKIVPHLIRNAADHGLEDPAYRSQQQKPETGKIVVQVGRHKNELVVSVADDGRGIDHKNIERIFQAGFSSAVAVSEVSGRGVGLDAVKFSVESVGGQVEVSSDPGKGTVFTIKLPI